MFDRNKFFRQYQMKFAKDFKKALEGFSAEEQIDIIDGLLLIVEFYQKNPVDYKGAKKVLNDLQGKYKKRFLTFYQVNPIEYFNGESLKHIDLQNELKIKNAGSEENFFTEEERQNFLDGVAKQLDLHREMTNLTSESSASTEELKGTVTTKTKGKIKRERDDKATSLNQEQTALLIYCLRKTKIILKDEYLNNKEAGQAFSILTGYSADTLRQNLNKSEMARIASIKNVEAVAKAMKELQKYVEEEVKPEE